MSKEAGEEIYAKFDYLEFPRAQLLSGFARTKIFSKWDASPGTDLIRVSTNIGGKGREYCTTSANMSVPGIHGSFAICFRDHEGDGEFDSYRADQGTPVAQSRWKRIKERKPKYEELAEGFIDTGFRRELVYSGRAGEILTLAYREYSEHGFARPAFAQDVTFTMDPSEPTTIRFRGAEIVVMEAGNDGIRYVVRRGMSD